MGKKIAELTSRYFILQIRGVNEFRRAMSGTMKFQDALEMRLTAMAPSKSDVDNFLRERPPTLSTGIPELIQRLGARNTAVYLISGGFRDIIHPIAETLGIDKTHVHANTILYNVSPSR